MSTPRRIGLVVVLVVALVAAAAWSPARALVEGAVVRLTHRVGEPERLWLHPGVAPSEAAGARIAVAGDVGTGDEAGRRTGRAMSRAGRDRHFDALVLLGDNVYPSGDPARLEATVFRPFADTLARGARLAPVLGNHDVADGPGDRQLARLGAPGRFYARRVGPALLVALDSTRADDPAQLRWLRRTLDGSSARWKIAALHHPPYSAGVHGSDGAVRRHLVPALRLGGVRLVLAGHDHDYQRSRPIDGVTYVVSGGAAKLRPTGRADFTAYSASTRHFVDLQISRDRLRLLAVAQDGRVFDAATLQRGGG